MSKTKANERDNWRKNKVTDWKYSKYHR